MKKLIIPAVLAAALLISSCGGKKDAVPSASPASTPKPTFILLGETPPPEYESGTIDADIPKDNTQENSGNTGSDNENTSSRRSQSDSVSIINGSSTTFHAVYLTTNAGGNPGENIIGDTPLGEGEEIELPFANAPSETLTVVVEDENGIRYSAGGINLANGLTIELHLEGGVLNAYVY